MMNKLEYDYSEELSGAILHSDWIKKQAEII